MQRYAFKMFLNPGASHEYRRRHDAIWSDLKALIREKGVRNYSIHLDPETGRQSRRQPRHRAAHRGLSSGMTP
jgi:L-rhamnose mutarotase